MAQITDAIHEAISTFMTMSRSFLLRNFQRKVIEKIKTHFLRKTFFQKIKSFMRMSGKNAVETGRSQMTI
jgi:4-aminobutyrate aminotransferase-like enzyme